MPETTLLTGLQRSVLIALLSSNSRLRWHAYEHVQADVKLRGRGQMLGLPERMDLCLLPSRTVRKLITSALIEPVDPANHAPFSKGGNPYRDYKLSQRGNLLALRMKGTNHA